MRLLITSLALLFGSLILTAQQATESLRGNWINADGSNTWGIGFYEDFVVYNSQFWSYGQVGQKGELRTIELIHPDGKKLLKVYEVEGGLLLKDGNSSVKVEAQRLPENRKRKSNEAVFEKDFLKAGQVDLVGVLKAKGEMPATASVIYNETFKREQSKYTVKVDEYGRFKLSFPLESPQTVMLSVGEAFTSFMVEPDSKMAVWVDESSFPEGIESWYAVKNMLFMGGMAQENEEYRIYSPEYSKVRNYFENDSLQQNLEPMAYLDYRKKLLQSHESFNQAYFDTVKVSAKLREFVSRDVRLYAANDMMRYSWLHNMKSTRQMVVLPVEYVDRVKTMMRDDSREMLSGDYGDLISEMSRSASKVELDQAHKLRLDRIYTVLSKHAENDEGKALLDDWKAKELERKDHNGYPKLPQSIQTLFAEGIPEVAEINISIAWEMVKNKALQFNDLGRSAMMSRYVVERFFKQGNDVPEKIWNDLQGMELIPEVVSLLERQRSDLDILKNQRFVEGVSIESSEEDILGQLKTKYAGKVVYIDVWAVWCGPCISEFSYLPGVKESLKEEEDVVFVYLCAQSNKKGWETMVKKYNLKGENYFLDDNQYGLFDEVTNVTGFPTYMVITKEGKLVREGVKRPSAQGELVKQLKGFADRK